MSFKEKNIAVSLASFSLILGIYLISLLAMILTDHLTPTNVFRLWIVTIVLAIFVTVAATILTHIVTTVLEVIRTGDRNPKIEKLADERDQIIDLRGTNTTYTVSSLGVFISMLTYTFGRPPLEMFILLIFFGILAQVAGDISRLVLYRRGF